MTVDEHAAELVARLRRRERWLLALAAVRTELLSGGTVQDAMMLIAERCARLADADGAAVLLADDRGRLAVWAAVGVLADLPAGPDHRLIAAVAEPWAAAVLDAVGPQHRDDFPSPAHPGLAECWATAGPVLLAPIPARVGGGGVVICLRLAGAEPFDPESQPELVGLAEQASIAVEVAERAQQRRALEVMADRERIARDLHDHVIQRLFAIGLSLQGQVSKIADDAARDKVDYAVGQIDEAIADLRSSIFDLRSAGTGASKNLRRRLADVAAVAGSMGDDAPRVSVRISGPIDTVVGPQLADDTEAVVREAISNAVKYSGARAVLVAISAEHDLEIVVTDDGCGMPANVARSGLKNLAQRAMSHGGTFEVDGVMPGGKPGTRLRWVAPLS